ncbi:unnamed protein product [Rodentolepis nana]|uniref:Uncharacterized protein n=1 Tax=Rodentolepis nana TaxID=102285 RepID=A0A158QH53_RODNA|nr:unnamed protein product [Rodentolepis nana]
MSSSTCFDNHNITSSSSGSYYESTAVAGEPLTSYHHHHQQQHHHHPLSTSALMCSTIGGGTNGIVIPASQPPLTQSLDISVLDSDAFPSPEQEGRRDSFSMAVDLLSRLEKRPSDTSSCNSTASPPVIQVASAWNNSVSPPPSKSAKFDPSSTTVATSSTTPGPAFYVPIAEKDLQLLTEPSMVNYVTDAATEDQLVREQYSPS